MTKDKNGEAELTLTKVIKAPRDIVFNAWTEPKHLKNWWGPGKVHCPEAHIDLKVGGKYRIANKMEDGSVLWISGQFEEINPPEKLVYDWYVGEEDNAPSLVTVLFREHVDGTELVIWHACIGDVATRDMHGKGWLGCLEKLEAMFV